MNTPNNATQAGAPTPSLEELRGTVENIDALSQEGFSEIRAIARLCIRSLETPEGHGQLDTILHALHAIWDRADSIDSCIRGEASAVGCAYENPSELRFWIARQKSTQTEGAA